MSASNEELLNSIQNYQRSFEKCASLCYTHKMVLQEIQRGKENAVDTANDATCADEYVNDCCHEENSDKKIINHQDVDGPSIKHRKSKSSIDGYITKRHHNSDYESKGDISEEKHNKSSKRNRGNECSENEEERHASRKYRHSKESSDSRSYKKQRSFKSNGDSSATESKSIEEVENKKPDYVSSSVKEKDKSKLEHKANSKSKTKSKHYSKSRHDKDSSKYRGSKSHSSRSGKHGDIDKKESRDKSKETRRYRKGESRSLEKNKDEKESRENHKNSSSNQQEESSQPSRSSSKQKSSSGIKKDIIKRLKPANSETIINGVDSSSGTSITEVLGMSDQWIGKSSNSIKNKSSSLANYEKPRSSLRYMTPENTNMEEGNITSNNSSVNSSRDSPPKVVLSQDETLSQFVSNKTRTKVCTGKRSPANAETLYANTNALKHTGGAPYITLKPVLEKATPEQLFNVEHQNPYLIGDTDELWQLHCQTENRKKKRAEQEFWREMYMRCLNEREERLNAVTAKIKQSQNKPTTIRTTKLAYIDSLPKPSRDIARKQAKNDATAALYKKPAQTPASRLATLASQADTGKANASNPERKMADRPIRATVATVKRKAPLMAKTLLLMKNRFKR